MEDEAGEAGGVVTKRGVGGASCRARCFGCVCIQNINSLSNETYNSTVQSRLPGCINLVKGNTGRLIEK